MNTLTNLKSSDDELEVLWVKVNTPSGKPFALGVFYGKQENVKEEVIEAQFKALLTDIHLLMQDHRIILAGDFNAKLKIQKVDVKQEQSQNGRWLQELIELSHMQIITLNDEKGQWTRQNRTNPNEKSVIDYVLTDTHTQGEIDEIEVDQEGHFVLKGENGKMSDHNTIMFTLNADLKQENKVKIVWKKGDKRKWEMVNRSIVEEWNKATIKTYNAFEETVKSCMLKHIGKKKISLIKGKSKESDNIKQARQRKRECKKAYSVAIKTNSPNKLDRLKDYMESQQQLREEIEKVEREKVQVQYDRLINEGGTKSRMFWKIRKQLLNSNKPLEYDVITEEGEVIKEEEEAKEYIATYFEKLYCARPAKPEVINMTNSMTEQVQSWEETTNKQKATPVTNQELNVAIKSLKRGKSCGDDEIPNELFLEANSATKNVILQAFNDILDKKTIPEQWQLGTITKLYKGKGTKGKCSNERGITVSSNAGKLLERIINNRAMTDVQISDAQAGGRKKRATTDHLLILKDIIRQHKRRRKPLYLTFLDVTKAYDKAWLDGLLHNIYNRGVQGPTWNMIRKFNQNLRAVIKTRYGMTRPITIKDSIRQGGVLSVMMYSAMMDEIATRIERENKGVLNEKHDKRIGCLLWMDDAVLLSDNPGEAQEILNITNQVANRYHLEFGAEKSKVMVFYNKTPTQFKLGDHVLEETTSYKYLGEVINNTNTLDGQVKEVNRKAEAALQTILSIAGDQTLKNIQMKTIWKLVETCIMPVITYGGETWRITKKATTETNRILDNILKRILMTPTTTPREPLYMETGLLDIKHTAIYNRMNMLKRIQRYGNQLIDTSLERSEPDQWMTETKKIIEELGIDGTQPENLNTPELKRKINELFKKCTDEASSGKSKVMFLRTNGGMWEPGKRPTYMENMTRIQTSMIFKARTRMLDIKENFRGKYKDNLCRGCNATIETQAHVLYECTVIHKEEATKVALDDIFTEDMEKMKKASANIIRVLSILTKGDVQQLSGNAAQPGNPGLPDNID